MRAATNPQTRATGSTVSLCQNKRTGKYFLIDPAKSPAFGELVAVERRDGGLQIEPYIGQDFVGRLMPLDDHRPKKDFT